MLFGKAKPAVRESEVEVSWGRSRTNIFSTVPETRSEIKLNTLSSMNLQPKKDQVKTREMLALEQDVDYCLPVLQGQLFASIIEHAICQFRVFDDCNPYLRLIKTQVVEPSLRRLKFDILEPVDPDETDDINPNKLECIEYKINKLYKERDVFSDLLEKLYMELATKRCFDELDDYISDVLQKEDELILLRQTEAKNKTIQRELKKKLRNFRNNAKAAVYDKDSAISTILTKIEDTKLVMEIESRHVENWEKARMEQHVLFTDKAQEKLITSSDYYRTRADGERRVHIEIEVLTNQIINETLIEVENWMVKYETDMEEIDFKIQIQRNAYAAMKEKRINLEKTIALHNKQMWAWTQFKEERKKLQRYTNAMQKSAIIVQAWWRGIIVRKQLGPFRQQKKKTQKKQLLR